MFEFLNSNALFVVLIISLVVWAGIYFYMVRLQKRIETLEQDSQSER